MIGEKIYATQQYVDEKIAQSGGNSGGESSSSIQIDSTLTITGAAADAKAVGDALKTKQPVGDYALKSEIPTDCLKGEKGDKGDTGAAGYSPVRGTDYWTDSDKAEIKAYVDEAILGGAW